MQTNRRNILHVDDAAQIRALVEAVLEEEDGKYSLTSFGKLVEAKDFIEADPNAFDLTLIDGNINRNGDGHAYAKHLHDRGFKVLVLASEECPGLPFLSKGEFGKNPDTLPEKIEEVLAA